MVGDNYLLKICILCIPDELLTQSLCSYAVEHPDPSTRSTIGVLYPCKMIKVDTYNVRLILTDISTNPFYEKQRTSYCSGASAAVFAFSKSDHTFVESAIDHYHEFRIQISAPTVPVVFIGLHDESEVITLAEGQSLAQELGVDYFEMAVNDLQALDTVLKSLSRKVIALKTIKPSGN